MYLQLQYFKSAMIHLSHLARNKFSYFFAVRVSCNNYSKINLRGEEKGGEETICFICSFELFIGHEQC